MSYQVLKMLKSPDGKSARVVIDLFGGMFAVVKYVAVIERRPANTLIDDEVMIPVSLKFWTGDLNRTISSWRTNIELRDSNNHLGRDAADYMRKVTSQAFAQVCK